MPSFLTRIRGRSASSSKGSAGSCKGSAAGTEASVSDTDGIQSEVAEEPQTYTLAELLAAAPTTGTTCDESQLAVDPSLRYEVESPSYKWVQGYLKMYVQYEVHAKTSRGEEWTVHRRYKEFYWLRRQLVRICPAVVVPALPLRHKSLSGVRTPEQLQKRHRGLKSFLHNVSIHPVLRLANVFQDFLRVSKLNIKDDLPVGQKHMQYTGFLQMSKSKALTIHSSELGDATLGSLYEYVKVLTYELDQAQSLFTASIKARKEMATAMQGYSDAFRHMGAVHKGRVSGIVTDYANLTGDTASAMLTQGLEEEEKLQTSLEHWSLMVKSMHTVLVTRHTLAFVLRGAMEELNTLILRRRAAIDQAKTGNGAGDTEEQREAIRVAAQKVQEVRDMYLNFVAESDQDFIRVRMLQSASFMKIARCHTLIVDRMAGSVDAALSKSSNTEPMAKVTREEVETLHETPRLAQTCGGQLAIVTCAECMGFCPDRVSKCPNCGCDVSPDDNVSEHSH
eukprot:GFYU01008917.1.p1 GENE.GFYU01008917.1~~GFYU01008917.1.p1  ORF type:complete len:507 (-),score=109.28 GFYU01008917.1:103-1623(-)